MLDTSTTEDAMAIDLIRASGVLNPNVTLDKLMDVSRQLTELEQGVPEAAHRIFVSRFYIYMEIPQ
jgi:hypothetical protein